MRIIINIILVVILIHLILKNINKNEYFTPNIGENKCYRELIDYVDKCNNNQIKPGNYYVDNENSSNFMSNVLNVNKFYDINKDEPKPICESENLSTLNINIEDQTCFPKRNLSDQPNMMMPDNWNYKNELPMNGGILLGNIVGYDSLNTGYAVYDKENIINKKCENLVNCNVQSDDIRFRLGYPNQEYREIR